MANELHDPGGDVEGQGDFVGVGICALELGGGITHPIKKGCIQRLLKRVSLWSGHPIISVFTAARGSKMA